MAADLTSGIVSRVINGDTTVLDTGEKIRFSGINSRKLVRESRPAEPLANETKVSARRVTGRWAGAG